SLFITDEGDLYLIDRYDGKLLWQSRPCMWPLPGSENNSSLYKIDKYNKYNHKYLDISNDGIGQKESVNLLNAVATFDGKVTNVEYGRVTIYHKKLDIYSQYWCLNGIRVKKGDEVKQNDILGKPAGWSFSFWISTDNPYKNPHPNYVDPYLYIVPPKKALFIQPKY
ncbi:MAG: M23 family metallopeptidase, partial [Clostridia bacterium]|nr:M23 family metallopeptidase [Clostridia bacterium]